MPSSFYRKPGKQNQADLHNFIELVKTSADTPVLIQEIAGHRFYMKCCAAVAKANRDKTPELWRLWKEIENQALWRKYSIEELRLKLGPVAAALGLGPDHTGSVQADYYHILGVLPNSDQDAIKKAFRKKARQVHPDTSGGSQEQFLAIHEAYEVLSHPELRRQYDKSRTMAGSRWSESPDVKSRQSDKKPPSVLRRYGYQMAAVIAVLAGISVLADQVMRDEQLNQYVYVARPVKKAEPEPRQEMNSKRVAPELEQKLEQTVDEPEQQEVVKQEPGAFAKEPQQEVQKPEKEYDAQKIEAMPEPERDAQGIEQMLKENIDEVIFELTEINEAVPESDSEPSVPPKVIKSRKAQKPANLEALQVTMVEGVEIMETPAAPAGSQFPEITDQRADRNDLEITDGLNDFLNDYCSAYESLNLKNFLSFFADSATENGQPLSGLIGQYKNNFYQLSAIRYNIDMKSYYWNLGLEQVRVKGDFALEWTLDPSDKSYQGWQKHLGKIEMLLNKYPDNTFNIQKLNYTFQ